MIAPKRLSGSLMLSYTVSSRFLTEGLPSNGSISSSSKAAPS